MCVVFGDGYVASGGVVGGVGFGCGDVVDAVVVDVGNACECVAGGADEFVEVWFFDHVGDFFGECFGAVEVKVEG